MPQLTMQQALEAAVRHHQAGRLQEAEQLYRQILVLEPGDANALHLLGVIAHQMGRNDVAVELIRQAIARRPHFPQACNNLGSALRAKGQIDEALAACRQAIALNPRYAEAHNNYGNALRDKGQRAEAQAAYLQAIALKPDYPEAHYNLGNVLGDQGQLDAAIAAYQQAIALKPDYADAYNNLGSALREQGQLDAAMASYRQAIALKPAFPEAYNNLGVALTGKGQLDDAVEAYRHAMALQPGYPEAHGNLAVALKDKGEIAAAIALFRQAIALDPGFVEAHSNLVFDLHYHRDYDARAIAEEHRQWNHRHAAPLKRFMAHHGNDRSADRRLRIGYVSPDFREHSVGRFLLPLLAHHDKSAVEVFAYAQVAAPDAMTQRLGACTDGWRTIVGFSDGQVADLIRQDQIDILVDLAMHTSGHRLLVFARKPAPVQATYLAYCSSTGLETMDFRLSDPYLDPSGGDESVYREQTMRLPETYWCYQASVASGEVGGLPALKTGFVTFGCLNNFCKVSETALALWAGILRLLPNSQLLLHAPEGMHRQRVRQRLERGGIAPRRLRFAGKVPLRDYFRLYDEIDIALDTFPFGGGTTTCDALWMGVPVVSLAGKTAVGRAGLSILSNLGLPELAACREEEYVRIAVELAGDLARLEELRSSLRTRMARSPLMDAPRFAGNMEAAYRAMWKQWCARQDQG